MYRNLPPRFAVSARFDVRKFQLTNLLGPQGRDQRIEPTEGALPSLSAEARSWPALWQKNAIW